MPKAIQLSEGKRCDLGPATRLIAGCRAQKIRHPAKVAGSELIQLHSLRNDLQSLIVH